MSKTALIVIAEGSEEIEAITPGDVLQRAGVDITYAAIGTLTPRGGHGVPLRADMLIEDVGGILFDALVLPGGGKGAENMLRSSELVELIKRHWEGGKIIAAICATPAVVLGPLGILSGRHATCFPGLERRFPKDVKDCTTSVCVDGHLVTSRGPGTAMEFSIRLAELLTGAQNAIKIGQAMLVPNM
jgi:4-methyl-5(b-hydroxyethyl)-thiazole monophosphate biosynthesis